ncbi:head-tail connector protein [Blastochloris tepida]|uniref:Phage gp6-like head-tail connector protein n=1 Tax=Blastochloris tepida TaxID=2233851 RepID=A0A348G1E0_9HYPH|nr:head-tail connector protein [Blastochloris tepida]BBF93373.1 hypothetical protein BLTE_20580 [Blastochloris tepida]
MSLAVVTPPSEPAVSLAEAKAHLRVDHADDDALIESLVAAASDLVEAYTQRRLLTQALDWTVPAFRPVLVTPLAPVTADGVVSIKYRDAGGAQRTLDPSAYIVRCGAGEHGPAVIRPAAATTWPAPDYNTADPVVLRFTVGFGAAADVPAPIKAAILLVAGALYANREAVVPGTSSPLSLDTAPAVTALLIPYLWEP